jgi:hypothetical protein
LKKHLSTRIDSLRHRASTWAGHTNHLFRLFRSSGIHGQINSRCGFEPGVHQSFTSIDQPEGRTISSNPVMCKMFHLPQLRRFYRGDLSVSVHTTVMVFQREKIISGNTSAMVEEIEPISLPLRWSNCDGFLEEI